MLHLEDVWVTVHGFTILRGISMDVGSGEVVGLVGRNGAGKTSTLKSIMGLVAVSAGRILFGDRSLVRWPAYRRARLGIGYMPEDRRLIGPFTVEENLLLPLWARGGGKNDRLQRVYELLPEVAALARRRAGDLSGGQQKLVALARALMGGSRLLLLDEPFEGLSPALASRLSEVIRMLRSQELALLICESDPKPLTPIADAVYTIERGRIIRNMEHEVRNA